MDTPAKPPKVTVGVCGGIAAYKAVELVRALQDAGFDPHVAMSAAAEQFVAPLTFAAISGHRVITSLWTGPEIPGAGGSPAPSSIEHIAEAQTTACLILVPATANTLAKLAHGIADDFLTTLYLATPAPVILAPAMNSVMWAHPAVQANVETLRRRGNRIVQPASGHLACGMTGDGRLAPLEEIVRAVRAAVQKAVQAAVTPTIPCATCRQDLELETVLITAGGTREPIDQVRFLGNRSSGRMGFALAEEALARGARVILIAANASLPAPARAELIPVSTAAEMRQAVLAQLPRATLLLKAAAVADFRPAKPVAGKLRRSGPLTLNLEPTEDILAEAAARKSPGTLLIAFAAESSGSPAPAVHRDPDAGHEVHQDLIVRAREKLLRKGADAIVLNDIAFPGLGFDSDRNAGVFLTATNAVEISPTTKRQMAAIILDQAVALRQLSNLPALA